VLTRPLRTALVPARPGDRAEGPRPPVGEVKSPDSRPSFVHTLAHDGNVLDPLRDTYDHAFVVLALSTCITGCPTGRYRGELLASVLRHRDGATGCLIDEGDTIGTIKRHRRRLWPQTETAKAWIAQAERAKLEPPMKRARPRRGSNGIISTIPSRAAGTINSIVTAGRWSRPSRPRRLIM
jgi:mannose/cellobiose epimerase-like protein (N-acyl-D-glucosamine 2-epimerase family)